MSFFFVWPSQVIYLIDFYFIFMICHIFYSPFIRYRISGIFGVGKFWRKWRLEGVLNFHRVIFSLFQGLSMKTYSRVYFFAVSIFGDFGEVANSAKIKPARKIPDILYYWQRLYFHSPMLLRIYAKNKVLANIKSVLQYALDKSMKWWS